VIFDTGHPIVIAHRGSRLLWPENTLPAFSAAAGLGARFFETDLRLTADGVVMCHHDSTLDRTTNGSGPVRSRTRSELQEVDAGYRHRINGSYPFRGEGVGIPTLEELLTTFLDHGVIVDLKEEGLEAPLWQLIERLEAHSRLIVGSFSSARVQRFRIISGGSVAVSGGPSEITGLMGASRLGIEPSIDVQAMQVPVSWYGAPVITPRFVETAHRIGLLVHAWTINEPEEAKRLLALGVDGLITDRPDLMSGVVAPSGPAVPAA
jgi:glycerophosphoryl diester phosphodiesterase